RGIEDARGRARRVRPDRVRQGSPLRPDTVGGRLEVRRRSATLGGAVDDRRDDAEEAGVRGSNMSTEMIAVVVVGLLAGWVADSVLKAGGYGVAGDLGLGLGGGILAAILVQAAGIGIYAGWFAIALAGRDEHDAQREVLGGDGVGILLARRAGADEAVLCAPEALDARVGEGVPVRPAIHEPRHPSLQQLVHAGVHDGLLSGS